MVSTLNPAAEAVLDVIKNRATTKVFTEQPVERAIVEQIFEAAIQAPNHHLNQPWRFQVYTGAARHRLVDTLIAAITRDNPNIDDPRMQTAIEKIQRANVRAPVVIVVAQVNTGHQKAKLIEDTSAVSAAAQNLVIAATSFGLGTYWRTGPPTDFPSVPAALGLQPEDRVLGFIDIGYPAERRKRSKRLAIDEVTAWFDS